MKVVINGCFGGFGLSAEAIYEYAKLKGINVYGYVEVREEGQKMQDAKYRRMTLESIDAEKPFITFWLLDDIGELADNEKLNNANWFHENEIKRDDEALIKVVKKLKGKANGHCASLRIVEIPDGTDYVVEEYDGSEHIAEKHQTWR